MKLLSPDPSQIPPGPYPACHCFNGAGKRGQPVPRLHHDVQDTECSAWLNLLGVVEQAIREQPAEFSPLDGFSGPERARIVTLPSTIAQLTAVRKLRLYGSHLSRIPPEIGGMSSLEYLDVYTSYRLHYVPYELTRCHRLKDSRMSTRALFGNYKNRGKFPDLLLEDNRAALDAVRATTCSVCGVALQGPAFHDRWLTLVVGTDWVPLLATLCGQSCIHKLPTPPEGYVPRPHTGGSSMNQPAPDR